MKITRSGLFKTGILAQALTLALQAGAQVTELETTTISGEEESGFNDSTVIDLETIDREYITNITDIVRHIPGVQVSDTGDRYGDSGFNIRGLDGDAVSITVDGIDQGEFMIDPNFAPYAMYGNNRNITEIETVKAVEVVKGPNSINLGSGAMAGSVAFTTKDPEDILGEEDLAVKVKTGYESRNEETLLNATVAGRLGDVDAMLIVTRRDQSETKAHSDGADVLGAQRGQTDPFARESNSVLGKLIYNLSEAQQLGLVVETSSIDKKGQMLSRNSSSYFDFGNNDTAERDRYGVFYKADNADNVMYNELDVRLDIQELYSRGVTFFSNSSRGAPPILREEDRSYRQESTTFAVDLLKAINLGGMSHSVNYGIDWKQSDVENVLYDNRWETTSRTSTQTQHLRDPSWVPKTERTSTSLYLQDTLALNEQWSLNAGIRHENTEYSPTVDETFVDPTGASVNNSEYSSAVASIAASYEFVPGHSIIASYGQGYKSPTTAQLYMHSDNGDEDGLVDINTSVAFDDWDTVANPDLEAEESISTEISYLWEGAAGRIKLTYFETDYENMIQEVRLSRPLGQTIELESGDFTDVDFYDMPDNIGEVTVDGFEFEALLAVNQNLYFSFAYSTINGEHKTSGPQDTFGPTHDAGDDLLSAAPDNFVSGLYYNSTDGKWGASAFYSWTDSKDEKNQTVYTTAARADGVAMFPASYSLVDLTAYYNITDALKITAALNNVTDKKYWRWEVVNNQAVIDGTSSGFQPTVDVANGGMDRFSGPGRNGSVSISYAF